MKTRTMGINRIIAIGPAIFFFLSITIPAGADAGTSSQWADMPAITLELPGKADDSWKERCGSERCACAKYVTLGVPDMEAYYGDIGPGLALGYRACQIAFALLYPGEIPPRGDQFVVSSLSTCPVDPVTFITGARYGRGSQGMLNGNLVFDEKLERFSFIFAGMSSGKAYKLTCIYHLPQEFLDLQQQKKHDPKANEQFWTLAHCLSRAILTAPARELYESAPLPGFDWKQYKEKSAQ